MTVAFGRGEYTWSNVGAPSVLVERMGPEIKRFGRVLRRVASLRLIFVFVSIKTVLRLWRFDAEFGARLVYPLTALFFGTGNRTPKTSAAIIAAVFLDPKLRLFEYSEQRLLAESPEMIAFDKLGRIYDTAATVLVAAGVEVCLSRAAARIERRPGARDAVLAVDAAGRRGAFDAVVFACDASAGLAMLDAPSFWERFTLGNVLYYHDVTYTHCDTDYMCARYELHSDAPDSQRPDYFIYSSATHPECLEMSFDLGHYQPHLRSRPQPAIPIYQTIFLDRDGCESTWTVGALDKTKTLLVKWWRQFSHEASHFRRVVPFVRFIQGGVGGTTLFAGSWTLVNTHEVATISGLAAAHRLGADYPFAHDKLAAEQFATYLSVAHGGAGARSTMRSRSQK